MATIRKPWRSPSTRRRRSTRETTRGGEKCRTDAEGPTPKALDHDPPAKRKWTPLGILVLATGALTLIFTSSWETSDFWVDALQVWWLSAQAAVGAIRRLVTYLDS